MQDISRLVLLIVLAFAPWGCRRAAPPPTNEVVAVSGQSVPLQAGDPAWEAAPEHVAKLLPQDLVDPRLMSPSTPEVRVRAVTTGTEIAFRLQWADPEQNDKPGPGLSVDACAVQLPRMISSEPPAPQMGEAGRPVDITFWRSDWQASVNGRGDKLQDLYPNATVDHYPFAAPSLEQDSAAQKEMSTLYSPAGGAGNRRAGPRETPVEDLVAEGPGTLSPAPSQSSRGFGARTADGWAVVIRKNLSESITPDMRTQVAFAIWEGSAHEAGARKMRTGWIPLVVRGAQ